ncbi:MAG TPA: hypothetical protein VNL71_18255 [Chloroflexota bacterium]|nr:hypothetical protein [Chloroflexota bacterium]
MTFGQPGDVPTTWHPGQRILLINPPISDLRIPWAEWIEPTGLLKLATFLRDEGRDVRLLDAFHAAPRQRERDAVLERGGQVLSRWRYGLRAPQLRAYFRALVADAWIPDDIVITTLTDFWWHGAVFMQAVARAVFPQAHIVLGGLYPTAAPAHARIHSGANLVLQGPLPEQILRCVPAYDLYGARIAAAAITDLEITGADRALAVVKAAAAKGATRLHLADHGVASTAPDVLKDFLQQLEHVCPRTRLYVLGAISPEEVATQPNLLALLRAARCRKISLADNRAYASGSDGEEAFLANVATATQRCHAAGFRPRTNDYSVGLSIGRPGESPIDDARLLARLAHVAGTTVPIPYQPDMEQAKDTVEGVPVDPWESNGKLFPLAERNGASFMEYMEVLGLAAVVNAKHRTRTFDFGADDSLIARSLRRALGSRTWDPHEIGHVAVDTEPTIEDQLAYPGGRPRIPHTVLPVLIDKFAAVAQGE